MRTNRSIRNRGRRPKREALDLDITSLLDILVIMLVFLLKSYNSSGIILNVPKEIALPSSNSQSVNNYGVNIQVSTDTIWVDDQVVMETEGPLKLRGGNLISPLYNELVRRKNVIKQTQKTSPEAQKFSGIANLILDKTLKYNEIRKIMHTTAAAGFKTYKFVVLGEDM